MIKGSAGNGLPLDHERTFKRALIGFAQIHDGISCHIFSSITSPKPSFLGLSISGFEFYSERELRELNEPNKQAILDRWLVPTRDRSLRPYSSYHITSHIVLI